uniref:Uncharacterized protein n=1 Tax=Mesocestoides corti TaxID=53468 RepID=A0A5K3FI57_MESCO
MGGEGKEELICTEEFIRGLIQNDPALVERLVIFLSPPDEEEQQLSPSDRLVRGLCSPDSQAMIMRFADAFQTWQLGTLISEFSLGEDAVRYPCFCCSGIQHIEIKETDSSIVRRKQREGVESERKKGCTWHR